MQLKRLNAEERSKYHGFFRKNDLFRHWHPILSTKEKNITKIDAISLWHNADNILDSLRTTESSRDEMIVFIHSELARETDEQIVACLMAIVLTRLMNAAQEGHEEEHIPNDAVCIRILEFYEKDLFFKSLMEEFFFHKHDYDGNKIVIAPSDPMTQKKSFDDFDNNKIEDIRTFYNKVMELTGGLKRLFEDWGKWEGLWMQICMDAELANRLSEVNPRNNEWHLNQKLICNVVGIFIDLMQIQATTAQVNRLLSTKQISSYISQPKDFYGSNSALTREQYNKIESMIRNL